VKAARYHLFNPKAWSPNDVQQWFKDIAPETHNEFSSLENFDGKSVLALSQNNLHELIKSKASALLLWTKLNDLRKQSLPSEVFDASHRRVGKPIFFGRYASDDEKIYTEGIKQLRTRAKDAFTKKDQDEFLKICFNTLTALENLPQSNPLHIPPSLLYVGSKSPVREIMLYLLQKAFLKAQSVVGFAAANNHSGYALHGDKGVGKSTTQQVCAILTGILLDNIISVFVDYSTFQSPEVAPLPHQLLLAAADELGIQIKDATTAKCILTSLQTKDKTAFFFADEVQHIYSEKANVWPQLHQIATDYHSFLCLAGSSSNLRELVEGNDIFRIKQLGFDKPLMSLNGTKLSILEFPPFAKRDQYREFLRTRYPKFLHGPEDTHQLAIDELHTWTGGYMREISQYIEKAKVPKVNLPPNDSLEWLLLRTLYHRINRSTKFDPFDLPTITIQEIQGMITKYNENLDKKVSLNELTKLIEEGRLRQVGKDLYTFGRPYVYIKMRALYPRVFLSHAWEDITKIQILVDALQQFGVDVTFSPEQQDQNDLSTGIKQWMHNQTNGDNHHFIFIFLTENYTNKVENAATGVGYEYMEIMNRTKVCVEYRKTIIPLVEANPPSKPKELAQLDLLHYGIHKNDDMRRLYARITSQPTSRNKLGDVATPDQFLASLEAKEQKKIQPQS
jgi:hypothetical protein